MKKSILIIDFGSQYTHLIKAVLEKSGIGAAIVPGDEKLIDWKKSGSDFEPKGVILSGGAASVYDEKVDFDKSWLKLGIPVLGICYGHQLVASAFGGKVERRESEYAHSRFTSISEDQLFANIPKAFDVWMSHRDAVTKLPKGYSIIGASDYSEIAAFRSGDGKIYGLQFHPEVSHTENGEIILKNFCIKICGISKTDPWTANRFVSESGKTLKSQIGKKKIIFGLSGGVDSLTMAALLRKYLPREQLLAVYVDSGLMPDETIFEVKKFCKAMDIDLFDIDSSNDFFEVLKGITDPGLKGMAIGRKFIEVFEEIALRNNIEIFAQGTIWSDVVESGVTKFSSQIKPHHNVGGLPEKLKFELLEPLRELFKDQVREVAAELGLPDWVVNKKVFPGPGYAIRVQGEVTPEKVSKVRKATKIIEEILFSSKIKNDIWMAFAIYIDVPSLGVKGDERVENKNAIVIRIVESRNSMTAEFSRKSYVYLSEISKRITNELDVGRVVYDITDKPPATIEWQ